MTPKVNQESQTLTCPDCDAVESVKLVPLFIVTGASGVGKTSVVAALRQQLPDFDVFETDILWDNDWQHQRDSWLRIAYSIGQSGRGTILCGTMMPEEIQRCDYFPLFRTVYFLNLHCDDQTRERRLKGRPAWRQSGSDEFIAQHKEFADWLLQNADTAFNPPMPTVDTSNTSILDVATQIKQWVEHRRNS